MCLAFNKLAVFATKSPNACRRTHEHMASTSYHRMPCLIARQISIQQLLESLEQGRVAHRYECLVLVALPYAASDAPLDRQMDD